MKAIIRIVTAKKEFRQDQLAIMKRVALVLIEHNLSVDIQLKSKVLKKIEFFKLRVSPDPGTLIIRKTKLKSVS